ARRRGMNGASSRGRRAFAVPEAASELEGELDGEALVAGRVAEQFCGAADALQDGVAVRVEARGGPWCVLGFLEEDAQRLAQPRGRGRVLGEPPERCCDEVDGALLVLGDERRDLELVVGGDPSARRVAGEQALDR